MRADQAIRSHHHDPTVVKRILLIVEPFHTDHDLDHLHPNLQLWYVVQDLIRTAQIPTQETCDINNRSCRIRPLPVCHELHHTEQEPICPEGHIRTYLPWRAHLSHAVGIDDLSVICQWSVSDLPVICPRCEPFRTVPHFVSTNMDRE